MSTSARIVLLVTALIGGCLSGNAFAQDGAILIDQTLALAGGITPDDGPGFPVVITRSGTYRLSGNLSVSDPDVQAIAIFAGNVTIDLNGFTIAGPADACGGRLQPTWCQKTTAAGVVSSRPNVAVVNGTVRAMNGPGVLMTGPNARIARMSVRNNRSEGVYANNGGVISDSRIFDNRGNGIACTFCVVTGNMVWNNVGYGFIKGDGLEGPSSALGGNVFWFNNSGGPQMSPHSIAAQTAPNMCNRDSCSS